MIENCDSATNAASGLRKPKWLEAKEVRHMYEQSGSELRSILNETRELQSASVQLQTDAQRVAFVLNLHNLLSIHAHLATLLSSSTSSSSNHGRRRLLFRNRMDEMLLEQRAAYAVGELGIVSLHELRRNVFHVSKCNVEYAEQRESNSDKDKEVSADEAVPIGDAFAVIDEDADRVLLAASRYDLRSAMLAYSPHWAACLPSEAACNDPRLLFALVDCAPSGPSARVYTHATLDEQLDTCMRSFLGASLVVDLCYDLLYVPSVLVENAWRFHDLVTSSGQQQQQEQQQQQPMFLSPPQVSASLASQSLLTFLIGMAGGSGDAAAAAQSSLRESLESLISHSSVEEICARRMRVIPPSAHFALLSIHHLFLLHFSKRDLLERASLFLRKIKKNALNYIKMSVFVGKIFVRVVML